MKVNLISIFFLSIFFNIKGMENSSRAVSITPEISHALSLSNHVYPGLIREYQIYPHGSDNDGYSHLLRASVYNDEPVVKLLLELGASVNEMHKARGTPLYQAAAHNALTAASLLLDHKADVNKGLAIGTTPLHAAAYHGYSAMVGLLLQHNAAVNISSSQMFKNACLAAYHNDHKDILDLLLRYKGDPFDAASKKTTRLISAIQEKNDDITALLVQQGDDVNGCSATSQMVKFGNNEVKTIVTPLLAAIAQNNIEVVCLLLICSAFYDKRCTEAIDPLYAAVLTGTPEIVKAIGQARKRTIDLPLLDDGSTALHIAAKNGNYFAVRELILLKSELYKSRNNKQQNAYAIALENRQYHIVKFLESLTGFSMEQEKSNFSCN